MPANEVKRPNVWSGAFRGDVDPFLVRVRREERQDAVKNLPSNMEYFIRRSASDDIPNNWTLTADVNDLD